jgi:hypothetical protein
VAKDEVAPSLISVVEALRKRQQVGEAHLMELERRLQEKTGLLREGLQLVASLPTIDTSSPPPKDQVAVYYSEKCNYLGKIILLFETLCRIFNKTSYIC